MNPRASLEIPTDCTEAIVSYFKDGKTVVSFCLSNLKYQPHWIDRDDPILNEIYSHRDEWQLIAHMGDCDLMGTEKHTFMRKRLPHEGETFYV